MDLMMTQHAANANRAFFYLQKKLPGYYQYDTFIAIHWTIRNKKKKRITQHQPTKAENKQKKKIQNCTVIKPFAPSIKN